MSAVDVALERCGGGRCQWLHVAALWLLVSPALAALIYGSMMILLTAEHHCVGSPDRCFRPAGPNSSATVPCDRWEYDFSTVFPTITSELNWVCGNSWKTFLSHTLFWVGNTIGVVVLGVLADRYGRVPVVCGGHLVSALAGLAANFADGMVTFGLSRFLVGAMVIGQSMTFYVLVMESVPVHLRLTISTGFMFAYSSVGVGVVWGSYFLRNWRLFNALTTAPLLIISCLGWAFVESPRWLLNQGRVDEARRSLARMARINGKPDGLIKTLDLISKTGAAPPSSILGVFKFPALRRVYVLTNLIWALQSYGYTGAYLHAATLGKEPFVMVSVSAAVDVAGNLAAQWLAGTVGRRGIMAGSSIVAYCCYAVACNESLSAEPLTNVNMAMLLCGRFALTMGYNVSYLYAAEVFPTAIRSQAMALRQAVGSVGNFLSSQAIQMDLHTPGVSLLTFSLASLLTCGMSVCLPETLGKALPESLEDGEQLALSLNSPLPSSKSCRQWFCRKTMKPEPDIFVTKL